MARFSAVSLLDSDLIRTYPGASEYLSVNYSNTFKSVAPPKFQVLAPGSVLLESVEIS